MKLQSRHKVDPSFNMSSMTDVVFLLLIFFILTSSNVPTGKKIDLPSGTKPTISAQKVEVSIDGDKNYFVNKKKVQFSSLENELRGAMGVLSDNKLENVVVVKGDKNVSYGEIMEVVETAAQIENISVTLATKPK